MPKPKEEGPSYVSGILAFQPGVKTCPDNRVDLRFSTVPTVNAAQEHYSADLVQTDELTCKVDRRKISRNELSEAFGC